MGILEDISFSLKRIADAAERIADSLDKDDPPPTPGMGSIEITGELHTNIGGKDVDLIKFKVTVPAEATEDVVSRNVKVTLEDGSELMDVVAGRDTGKTKEFLGPQDSTVTVSIWNVDDGGNLSEVPRTFSAKLLDTVPPPTPGEAGVEIVGEQPA